MAIKKSELYSSLWASCDELRGGMDASEYKDYVLMMLFIKYISDKYAGVPYAPITVPKGASFKDMVALKGNANIGDFINKKIIAPIEEANKSLGTIKVDFDNPEKLGTGKEKVDRLSRLITIFEGLNFDKNKAEGDDLLGDAYEYLMRNFATESGKSKGQFYTPAEVSRIMAKIIGINNSKTSAHTTIYDPTCGSGSLLLKVADEAEKKITVYGQEKESATAGLARMNMVLHDYPTAVIKCTGNSTLSDPQFKENNGLKQFNFVVANPPFSSKNWSNGLNITSQAADEYGRFEGYGIPPGKNGDYAFLLHVIRSLDRNGKGAVILPHGVLFRGNAEAEIRKNLILRGYIKGIIGLPANLFYGTGIPACLIIIDKEFAGNRKAIFMIDAAACSATSSANCTTTERPRPSAADPAAQPAGGANNASAFANSPSGSAVATIRRPSSGCANASRSAWSSMRWMPSMRNWRLWRPSPWLVSPMRWCDRCLRWRRIWRKRPVCGHACNSA